MNFPESPIVPNSEYCVLYSYSGKQCLEETGMEEPGIDADLCPVHRAEMAAQRQVNRVEFE